MNLESIPEPAEEGVFGPEIIVGARTGESCLRAEDGSFASPLPSAPVTNAFLVWVGFAVLVVSEGVLDVDVPLVATGLRKRLGSDRLPVVFSRGRHFSGQGVTIAYEAEGASRRDLAKAEAYALVQLAWEEDAVAVHVDNETYSFAVAFVEVGDGNYRPAVTLGRAGRDGPT